MKTVDRMYPYAAFAVAAVLFGSSCSSDWGKVDPPAGVQTLPNLENVANFDFEQEQLDPLLFRANGNNQNQVPAIVEDADKGMVLELNDGWVEMNNPLTNYKCEKGASLTFWLKQIPAVITDDEGNESAEPQDLAGPLFAFTNQNRTEHLTFSANGGIEYDAADGTWSCDNPSTVTTGYMPVDGFDGKGWNYVALTVRNDGYDLYVNGEKKESKTVTDFDCSRLVGFMNNVATFSIGTSDNHSRWMVDDIKMYRNLLTAKETARPRVPWETAGPGGFDYGMFEYRVGSPLYTIGSPDCSGGWWVDFSNYFRIPADTNMRFGFVNHTSGGGNWNNWNLCLCTDADRGADGYAEYIVIRSDLYGWGDSYVGENWSNEGYGDWDQFRIDMEGADVSIDIDRQGEEVYITAVATAKNGTVYKESIKAVCGDGTQTIRAFLITDGSYLEMTDDKCYAYWPAEVTTPIVGALDNSSAWWTTFSDYFAIPSNLSLHLGFYNYTSGGGNWNNWNTCVSTDADRAADGYKEYFVVRSDLYGWGEAYVGDNWSNEGYGDWDQFRIDMQGAYVDLTILRENEKVTYKSVAKAENGNKYMESIWANCDDGTQPLRAFLICDGSHFELEASECYTYKPLF